MNRLKVMAAKILVIVVLLSLSACLSHLSILTVEAQQDGAEGNISFMPNVIPELQIHFVEEYFRFQWLENRFDLKLLVAYEDKLLSLRDFWEKTDRRVKWNQLKTRATESMYEFGYVVEDIPSEIEVHVDYLLWKIEGASFGVDEIEVETIEDPELEYNITRFHLPDNLVLSYEDLWLYDFTVSHPSKLETKVEGVKGKSSWHLDPITYSTPVITIVGGSEGSELNSQDVYDEVIAQGWNINATNSMNKQFSFNATYCLGNETVEGTTWFADENTDLLLWGPFPRYTMYIEVKNYAHLRFGKIKDSNAKTTEKGVHYIVSNAGGGGLPYQIRGNSGNEIELYSSIFTGGSYVTSGGDATAWNCEFHQMMSGSGWDMYRCEIGNQFLHGATGDFDDILVYSASYGWYVRWGVGALTFTNLKTRNCTYVACLRDTAIQLYLINADPNTWAIAWLGESSNAKLIRQYTFDLTFTFKNGSYAEGTSVTISNDYLGTSDSWILTSNGSIPQQTYSVGHYNQSGGNNLYEYNPYNITATLEGYQTYTTLFNITEQDHLKITLLETTTTTTDNRFMIGIFYGVAGGFILGILSLIAFVKYSSEEDEWWEDE